MPLAIVFGLIAVACFVYGLRMLRTVWSDSSEGRDKGKLAMILVVLVGSVVGFWRAVLVLAG